jgi:hypothetical protein
MAVIRLYRRFYRIGASLNGDSYSLINPVSLSANTYIKNTSTLVETNPLITQETNGVYYADLNPNSVGGGGSGEIYVEIENQIIEVMIL